MAEEIRIHHPINKERFAEKGEAIFRSIEDKLMPECKGKVVAIEIDSGDYFLGRTHSEAVDKAREKHPDKIFYLARVGARACVTYYSDSVAQSVCARSTR